MKNNFLKSMIPMSVAILLSVSAVSACGHKTVSVSKPAAEFASGGMLVLSVNPEIAISYDEKGNVTEVEGRNEDGSQLLKDFSGYEGKACRQVVTDLVEEIGKAGYFVEEVEGKNRQITIEIESGSELPYEEFLDDVITDIKECVDSHKWNSPVEVEGESDYGMTDYVDTDYGPENDGVTDYDDTDYGPNNDGVTDYQDTDYGPENDGDTDYEDEDAAKADGKKETGATDYQDTDYGPENDGVTDYDDTDYGPNNDGVTDYNDTDYGPNNDGVTDYQDTDYGPENDGATDYQEPADDGATDYQEADTEDSSDSDYDEGDDD